MGFGIGVSRQPGVQGQRADSRVSGRGTVASVTIVIPTYNRPGPLVDCIRSIVEGSELPSEIIVVGREGEAKTAEVLAQAQEICSRKTTLRVGWVTRPGHLPPVQKGLELAASEIWLF